MDVESNQSRRTEVPGQGQLRKNAVGLPGLIAQSLGVTAPELSAVIIAAVVATQAGASAPFAFLIAGVGALCLGSVYSRIARHVPNAGGTYAIVRHVLGRDVGFLSGWLLLAVGMLFVPALLVASAFLMENFFGLVAPDQKWLADQWVGWAIVFGAIVLALSYFGVQISARVLLLLTAVGVGALLVFDVAVLVQGGADGLAWTAFAPWNNEIGFGAFALAVGIAMTGFSGFETAVFLAEEAHLPTKHVPRAVIGAGLLAVVFFVITTFSIVTGYGAQAAAKNWPHDSAGAVVGLSGEYLSLGFGKFLLLLLAVSSLASALGTANFTSRVMFSWGRDGYLAPPFARTHPRHQTPHVALGVIAATTLVVFLVGLVWQGNSLLDGLTFFSWLLLCGATGILPVYALVAVSGLVHGRTRGDSALMTYLIPAVAFAVVATAEVTQFYPAQSGPNRFAPYVMVAWVAIGVIVRLVTRERVAAVEARPAVDGEAAVEAGPA
ncbi:MAG: APC family permease [Actinomycetes bacterium]